MTGPISPLGSSLLRYCTPLFPATMRYLKVISKSPTTPPRQIRKVLCFSVDLPGFAGSAGVVPVSRPSFTDHSSMLPSQPVRSVPLKSCLSSALARPATASSVNAVMIDFMRGTVV